MINLTVPRSERGSPKCHKNYILTTPYVIHQNEPSYKMCLSMNNKTIEQLTNEAYSVKNLEEL